MNMNIELIKSLLVIGSVSSVLSTAFVQKFKSVSIVKCSSCLIYMLFGIVFTLSFTDYDIINAAWVGLFSFLGADSLYKVFEDKLFKSYSSINSITEIQRE